MYTSNSPKSIPCICTTVKKVSRLLGRLYDDALSEAGINITQLAVLRCIARRSGEPMSHVADEMEMDRTSLYRAVEPMVRDGWVTITAGKDARSRAVALTRKGEGVLANAKAQYDKVQGALLAEYGKGKWSSLVKELNALADCAGAGV